MIIADNLNNSLNGYIDYIFEKLSENEVNVIRINPDSIDDYESLKNKLCDESISIPALAFYFVSSDVEFMEFGSDVLRTDITVGMELYTKNEYISRKIMDLIARETMKLDILVSRPDDAVTYHLKKLEGGFNVVAEDEVLFFGENIGIKIYSATTDISSVV